MSDGTDETSTPSAPEPGVHRLVDMLVEEVSLVDRAANKRRFLIVKRDAEMATKKKPEEGGTTPAGGAATAGTAAGAKTPPDPKKKPAKKPAAGAAAAKARKPPAKDPPDEEEEDEPGQQNGKTSKATPPKPDPDEDADEEEDEEQQDEPEGAPAVEDRPPGKKPRAKADESAPPEPGAPDDEEADEETPLSVALAALDSLTQAVEILSSSPDDGSQLASVAEGIKEAYDAITSAAGIEPDADEEEEPTDEATIAGLVASIQEMLTKIDSLTQALSASSNTPAATPTITTETNAPPDLAGTLAQVAQSMKSIDGAVKAQATRLEALEKRTGLPNSRPAGERVAKGDGDEDTTSWPIDMNRPRDRASVDKAVSFHDD